MNIELHWPKIDKRNDARQYQPVTAQVQVLPRVGDAVDYDEERYPVERVIFLLRSSGSEAEIRVELGESELRS